MLGSRLAQNSIAPKASVGNAQYRMHDNITQNLSKDLYRQYGSGAPNEAWNRFVEAPDHKTRCKWCAIYYTMTYFPKQVEVPKVMDDQRKALLDVARLMML